MVAGATGFAHSTVWKVLRRAGLSRPPRPEREPANRYEWPCPGDLLHMDVSEYVRFKRPGHRMTGDRRSQDNVPDGVDHVHAIVDDHSRLAYAEIHADARAETAAGFLERALAFYEKQGDLGPAPDDGQRLGVHARSRLSPAARRVRAQAPHHQALPTAHQRQGRALPPDDGQRVGVRTPLPLARGTGVRSATLARPLQLRQTA